MTGPREGRMSGQVLPIVALTITLVICMCAMAVDLSGAYRVEASQKQRLEFAKEAVMADLVAIKGDEAGFSATKSDVASALAADGFEGDAKVWLVELPESLTGALDRVRVVRVELTQEHESVLAEVMGSESTIVSSAITFSINPYSSTAVHRPGPFGADEAREAVELEFGGGTYVTKSSRTPSRAELPDDVIDEANDALSHLSGCGGTSERYTR